MKRNRIGILTWHYYGNFGSALQAYALQTTIKRLGFNVEIINYRNPKFGIEPRLKNFFKHVLSYLPDFITNKQIFCRGGINTIAFQNKYLVQSKVFYNINDLQKYASKYDTIVYGSDQIWAPNVFNPIYMGQGVMDPIRKVSYAASIGLISLPNEYEKKYFSLLRSFSDISVREMEGEKLLSSIGIEDVKVVLDPTLLLDVSEYRKIEKCVPVKNKRFIFCYFLNENHNYWGIVEKYAIENNCEIIGVSANPSDQNRMKIYMGLGADHFLWLVNHSHSVFTDSYHGSIFSLLLHKDLYIFKRFSDDDPVSQNSRIEQLVGTFQLKDRLISTNSPLSTTPIDYSEIDNLLHTHREKSMEFLINALK